MFLLSHLKVFFTEKNKNLSYKYIWYFLYEISFSRFKAWVIEIRIADCSINHERLLRRDSRLAGKCVRGHDRLAWNTRPIWRAQCRLNLDLHLYSIIIIEPVVKTRFNDTTSALLEFSSRREFVALRHLGQFLSFLVKSSTRWEDFFRA